MYQNELDKRIEDLKVEYSYSKMAQINIAELMTAIKVAPSYKEMVCNQSTPAKLVPNYINERDYFGKRPYLNKNAILLYMYLHFINPTAAGQVKLSIKTAADFMDLPKKTIRLNLKYLLRHDYIQYIPDDIPGIYIVYINNYDKDRTVREGFKGYLSITLDTFKELLQDKLSNINALRIKLRGLLQCAPGPNKDRLNKISFADFKRLLPSYVHIKDIKRLLVTDQMLNIFNVRFSDDESYCMIKPKATYDPIKVKDAIISDCADKVKKYIHKTLSQKKYASTALSFTEKDYNDISKIALRLPCEDILNGLSNLFENYSGKHVSSIGGLVRVLALESYDNRILTTSQ